MQSDGEGDLIAGQSVTIFRTKRQANKAVKAFKAQAGAKDWRLKVLAVFEEATRD